MYIIVQNDTLLCNNTLIKILVKMDKKRKDCLAGMAEYIAETLSPFGQ